MIIDGLVKLDSCVESCLMCFGGVWIEFDLFWFMAEFLLFLHIADFCAADVPEDVLEDVQGVVRRVKLEFQIWQNLFEDVPEDVLLCIFSPLRIFQCCECLGFLPV
ncbi:hypothetical protein Dimus_037996 [Dionaea muscipula]